MTPQEKILVIKLSALGDFIQALGPMKAIRQHHPEAHITLLTTASLENFACTCGYFNDIWIDRRPRFTDLSGWLELRRRFINGNFNRVYDLQNNDRTSFYLRLFPKKIRPEWVGAAHGASHRNTSPLRSAGHAFDGHVMTLGLVGIKNIAVDDLHWIKADLSDFPLKKPYALLVPGSAPQHPHKRWPAEKYGTLANHLVKQGIQPVIIGGKAEKEAAQIITIECPQAVDLTEKTSLFQIAALAREAIFAISNDTGPVHMIGPTGCKTLVLFSSHSNPKRHGPKGANITILQKEDLKDLETEQVIKNLEI